MKDEIRAILVRSRKDVGLAEKSRQGVGISSCCMSRRVVWVEYRGGMVADAPPEYTMLPFDREFVESVLKEKVKPLNEP